MRWVALVLLTGLWCGSASAATFDLARKPDGTIVPGLRIEGEIVPGDARRLLDAYARYGIWISPVYLRSKGGDVEEAMRLGTIIRRLRLETNVPLWDSGKPPIDDIKVDHAEDTICASACFLVYAGGATRSGNYLALHRPYLARKEAQALSDTEYVTAQKAITTQVEVYLADMDVDQYWIKKMFAANSQEQYMPTWAEADNKMRHLMGMVPSLEEVVLSKCKEDPNVDTKLRTFGATRSGPLTPADIEKLKEILHDSDVFYECEKTVLSDMRNEAFARENEPAVNAKCGPPPAPTEASTLAALIAKGQAVTPDEAARRATLFDLVYKARVCRNSAIYEIEWAATNRWDQEMRSSLPKPPPVAEDFDAKGLSAADMAKRGKEAYKAERWAVAQRWFRKAADLGNPEGMIGMSWIYFNGKGVPRDDAEAVRWVGMAADHGSTDAMESLGSNYAYGWNGVRQDYAEAMHWLRKAADLGSAQAMMDVGELYDRGGGLPRGEGAAQPAAPAPLPAPPAGFTIDPASVPRDYAEAMKWFRKAADAGNDRALVQIGHMYEFGLGVAKDEEQARQWMKKAATSDDEVAKGDANRWLVDHPSP